MGSMHRSHSPGVCFWRDPAAVQHPPQAEGGHQEELLVVLVNALRQLTGLRALEGIQEARVAASGLRGCRRHALHS